jgi:uncharacterized hydantoinase/oxoprolinase family protein
MIFRWLYEMLGIRKNRANELDHLYLQPYLRGVDLREQLQEAIKEIESKEELLFIGFMLGSMAECLERAKEGIKIVVNILGKHTRN